MEAATASPGSPEPSSRRGVRRRRLRTTPDSGESHVGSGVAERVLRARREGAGRINKSKTATCQQKPTNAHCRRGRPAGCPSKKTPVKNNTVKKSATKKESKRTPGPKLSKSNKQKAPNKSRGTPRKCNKDANMDALSCGEEAAALKQSNDNNTDMAPKKDPDDLKMEKLKQWTSLKEPEESQNEENSIKKEESTENTHQLENALDQSTEAAKKPDGQPKADKAPRQPKRRKKPPLQYVRCEIEGCGTVLAHPRYLQHHIKYQHQLKKEYVCDHPSCGRLFRLQKQLLRHAKHHTDQRDYICEFCARAFKSAHNLVVHRMIHTGEKPIQCEICGFTCRQKASLNWHMKKHDAEASYQFSCPICGKKFEKKDCVVAHKAKSHPEVLIAEALASNAASVKNSHATVSEKVEDTVSAAASTDQSTSVDQENQEAVGGTLTQLQQVVLPLASQISTPQGQFFQLQTCHAVQVVHEQTPTLVHLTPVHLPQISSNSHPQVLQGSTLLSLGHVTSLVPAAPLEPQAAQWDGALVAQPPRDRELWEGVSDHQWVREADGQMTTENELWEEVVVGGGHQDVREMENMWDANGERRKEDEGNVWERQDE